MLTDPQKTILVALNKDWKDIVRNRPKDKAVHAKRLLGLIMEEIAPEDVMRYLSRGITATELIFEGEFT